MMKYNIIITNVTIHRVCNIQYMICGIIESSTAEYN